MNPTQPEIQAVDLFCRSLAIRLLIFPPPWFFLLDFQKKPVKG
jgi:hypothetical protein